MLLRSLRLSLLELSQRKPLRPPSGFRDPSADMTAAVATAAMWISRAPTAISLQQLMDESSPLQSAPELRPDEAVSAVIGACLPRVTYAREHSGKMDKKRIRSFGDLTAVVPALENDSSG